MTTVKSDQMPAPDHQPDLGGKMIPVTGKGKIDSRPPSLGIGPSKAKPATGK